MSEPIVITGIGVVSSIGIGREEFWESLVLGASGVDEAPEAMRDEGGAEFAAPAMEFDVADYLPSEKNYLDRHSELAFAALKLALDDAQMALPSSAPERVGLALGACWGNTGTMQTFHAAMLEKGPKFAPPILFPHAYANASTSLLAIEYEIKGPHANFTSGMTAGADALAWAMECLRRGRADVMLAAGVDALSPFVLQGCGLAGLAGDDASRPFHEDRGGFVPGEAGVVLVLERAESAGDRGAAAVAQLAGCGVGGGPDLPVRIDTAMRAAKEEAGLGAADALFVAGNGSVDVDEAEAAAITDVAGGALRDVPVTALKAGLGEPFGAGGPALVAAGALAISHRVVPPTPEADVGGFLLPLVCDPQVGVLDGVLVNAVDRGGSAMSFVLRPAG